MPCNCCEMENKMFDENSAKADIKDYRKHGPAKQTQLILEAVRLLNQKDMDLLDIGGGVGAIHHELLQDTVREATHVDASSAYLKEAKKESERRGNTGRINFIHADFTDVAATLPQADIVTLDRLVCCYPDFRLLLKNASEHSRKAVALTYPRETWYLQFGLGFINFMQRLRKDPFRVFIHPIDEINALLNAQGFQQISMKRLFIWEMALYQRNLA
jgi:2-polyprenyl-3-methyl-5-hydroxy-6-metoxy-1,4-benzoquinol methylase